MKKQQIWIFTFAITQPVFVKYAIKRAVLINFQNISKNVLRIARQQN